MRLILLYPDPIAWGQCQPAYTYGFHGLSKYSPNYGEPFHGVEEGSIDQSGCTAFTYVYKIKDKNGHYVLWYPAHYSQIPVTAKALGPTASQKGIALVVEDSRVSTSPNPFNARIDISFRIENPDRVVVDVVDLRGNRISNLLDLYCNTGAVEVYWMGTDENGGSVASGTYFVRVAYGQNVAVKKVCFAK